MVYTTHNVINVDCASPDVHSLIIQQFHHMHRNIEIATLPHAIRSGRQFFLHTIIRKHYQPLCIPNAEEKSLAASMCDCNQQN